MDLVSVVVPTFNRLPGLQRAVLSLLAQDVPTDVSLQIITVDNSPDGNARDTIDALQTANLSASGQRRIDIMYLHEPRVGVSTARNTGVAAASGRWVAFLDDDEEACSCWIAALTDAAKQTGAGAVFGPVDAKSDGEKDIGSLAPYFSREIDRDDHADITDLAAYLGTNNSLFDREKCLAGNATFDPDLNESGGEDSLLLQKLTMSGRRFAWAKQAQVTEWAAQRRLNWAYIRKRKFLSGQIRVFVSQMARPSRWDQILVWMAVGLAQFTLAGAAALALRLFNQEKSARASVIAWGGLGKVLWMPRFRPALYGNGLVS